MSNRKECQHDINRDDHTVYLNSRTFMVSPEIKIGVCSVCYSSLQYEKAEDGTWVLKQAQEEDKI